MEKLLATPIRNRQGKFTAIAFSVGKLWLYTRCLRLPYATYCVHASAKICPVLPIGQLRHEITLPRPVGSERSYRLLLVVERNVVIKGENHSIDLFSTISFRVVHNLYFPKFVRKLLAFSKALYQKLEAAKGTKERY